MKRCRTQVVRVCLFLLAAVPAYCQRGTFGIDVGSTSDKFDSLSSVSGLVVGVDGQLTILSSNPKNGRPAILAGGEVRLPTDTQNHAKEYAVFGGLRFPVHNFSIGFNAQVRKIYLPPANIDNQVFVRDKMEVLEIPLVLKYNFGASRRAFIEAEGAPEFSPHFRQAGALLQLPNPNFDHGYFVRGTVGYVLGKWYAKVSYENRYFKFNPNPNNPNGLYNWKSNLISGGVGVAF
ncbi:MAG TPA: hypothetical protein VHV29_15925 [Terriglobales bacterium]|jgi:hypothetical protein|nr:hypothetical protein [Terriglobales bacterium]